MHMFPCLRFSFLILLLFLAQPLGVAAQGISVTIDDDVGEVVAVASGVNNDLDTEEDVFDSDEASAVISAPSLAGAGDDISDMDNFFDAEDMVPQGEMAKAGPKRVDPVTQPASRFVIVRKSYSADTKVAQLVSAERALSLGRLEAAITMFDGLYGQSKKDPRVLMGRAVTLQKLGRFDESMQMYEALSEVDPDNLTAKINMLGLLATRYPAVALQRLLALYEENRSNVALIAQIAVTYAKTGDAAAALHYLEIAASMEPENANHVFNMAIISDRVGEDAEAVSYYEQALEIDIVHGAGRSIPRDAVYERLAQLR